MSKEICGVVISDIHAGSSWALVPPGWRKDMVVQQAGMSELMLEAINYRRTIQRMFWHEFRCLCQTLPERLDYVLVLGDCTDGGSEKSGGRGVVTTDPDQQKLIAQKVLYEIYSHGCPKIYGVRGTGYHVRGRGGQEVEDDLFYKMLPNVSGYGDVLSVELGGVVHDLKHHIGRSSTMHNKQGPLTREIVINTLKHEIEEPSGNVFWRGHVHYAVGTMFPMSAKVGYTVPCLKLPGSPDDFGRRFSDFYDVGFYFFKQNAGELPLVVPKKFSVKLKERKLLHG